MHAMLFPDACLVPMMLEPAFLGLGSHHLHLRQHTHHADSQHPLRGKMITPWNIVLTQCRLQVARKRKGRIRCTLWTCLEDVEVIADILCMVCRGCGPPWRVRIIQADGQPRAISTIRSQLRFLSTGHVPILAGPLERCPTCPPSSPLPEGFYACPRDPHFA